MKVINIHSLFVRVTRNENINKCEYKILINKKTMSIVASDIAHHMIIYILLIYI